MNQKSATAFVFPLQKASNLKELKTLYAHMIRTATDQEDPFKLPKLVEFFALSPLTNSYSYAQKLFSQIKNPNLFLYNTMIRGSLLSCRTEEAILLYARMRGQNLQPNNFTFPFLLRCCEDKLELRIGGEIHGCILRTGFASDVYVLTTLLNLYAVRGGSMRSAAKVFEEMPVKDVVAWNSMISGHLKHGDLVAAGSYFDRVPNKSVVSWNSMLAGYANSGKIEEAERLFRGMPLKDTATWNSLISGYVHMGDMISAQCLFEKVPKRDVFSWTTMIGGYVKTGSYDVCLSMFHQMQLAKLKPTEVTFLNILIACSNLGALELGKWVHCYINRNGFMIDNNLSTALIDMYAKCGDMENGLDVFYSMCGTRDLITWTTVINGLATNGRCREALEFFSLMVSEGVRPDGVTFLGVLSACSHGGFIEEGSRYFNLMIKDHQIVPGIEHYSCMVDLIGRSGLLQEAEEFVKAMPVKPDAVIWGTLFGACQVHKNVEMGKWVTEQLLELDSDNTYAAASTGRWSHIAEARMELKERRFRRGPDCSSIEVDYQVHEFLSRGSSHIRTKEIYEMMEFLAETMDSL